MPPGRLTKYKPELGEQVYKLTLEGLSDKKIADILSISKSTLNLWKLNFPDFSDWYIRGRDQYNVGDVERSLLRTAKGFKYTEVTREISPKADPKTGKPQMRITKKVTKIVPGVAIAQFFHLKNRAPDRWRDRSELAIGGIIQIIAPAVKKPRDAGT